MHIKIKIDKSFFKKLASSVLRPWELQYRHGEEVTVESQSPNGTEMIPRNPTTETEAPQGDPKLLQNMHFPPKKYRQVLKRGSANNAKAMSVCQALKALDTPTPKSLKISNGLSATVH